MIDDKKIEEVAFNETYGMYGESESLENGFICGVHWAINEFLKDLWHPATEEPKKFRKILFTGGSLDTTDTTMIIMDNIWNTKVYLLEIKKWLYIEDLLPKTQKGDKL